MEIRYERNADGMLDKTPAGSWRPNRLQLINPFRKEETVYEFVPTPEAKALLDEYSSLIGRDMQVKHFGEEQLAQARKDVPKLGIDTTTTSGVFHPSSPDRVFLQKDANLATLVHELTHALDPNLSQQAVDQFATELEANSPVHNYDMSIPFNSDQRANIFRHYSQGPLREYDYELLAEKAASDYERKRGFDSQDIGDYPRYYLNRYMDNWMTSPAWRHYESTTDPTNTEDTPFSRARPFIKRQKEYVDELRSDDVFRGAVDEYFNKAKTIYDSYKGTGS